MSAYCLLAGVLSTLTTLSHLILTTTYFVTIAPIRGHQIGIFQLFWINDFSRQLVPSSGWEIPKRNCSKRGWSHIPTLPCMIPIYTCCLNISINNFSFPFILRTVQLWATNYMVTCHGHLSCSPANYIATCHGTMGTDCKEEGLASLSLSCRTVSPSSAIIWLRWSRNILGKADSKQSLM